MYMYKHSSALLVLVRTVDAENCVLERGTINLSLILGLVMCL